MPTNSATNGVAGPVVQLGRRRALLEPPVAHHGDPVGDRQRLLLVVGDEQGGDAELLLQPADLLAQLVSRTLASSADSGSSSSSTRGRRGERAGQRDPLLLAAGQLVRVPVGLVGEADQLQQLRRPRAPRRRPRTLRIRSPKATLSRAVRLGNRL